MNYPKDRFDEFPKTVLRRGAHRAPRTRLSKLGSWLIALAAVALLVTLGVVVMWAIDRQVQFTDNLAGPAATESTPAETSSTPTPTPTPTEEAPPADKTLPVTVLNGEGTPGLATAGSNILTNDGWSVIGTGDANSYGMETSVVYVASDTELASAEAVVELLGFGQATVDPNVVAPGNIIVVLGADSLGLLQP